MYDHNNRRPRGFGFVTFSTEQSVDDVFRNGAIHVIHEKQVEVKRAVPRDQMPMKARYPVPSYMPGAPGRGFIGGRGLMYNYPQAGMSPGMAPGYERYGPGFPGRVLPLQRMPGAHFATARDYALAQSGYGDLRGGVLNPQPGYSGGFGEMGRHGYEHALMDSS